MNLLCNRGYLTGTRFIVVKISFFLMGLVFYFCCNASTKFRMLFMKL